MSRARDHRVRMDGSLCPDADGCARLYHGRLGGPVPGDTCECCGQAVEGPPPAVPGGVRPPYDPHAGPWVAYRDAPMLVRATGRTEVRRFYVNRYVPGSAIWSWTSDGRTDTGAARFDTRADALAAVRAGVARARGVRTGAERMGPPVPRRDPVG